jgi:hypothetical protein
MYRFALETIRRHPWQFAANSIEQWAVQLGGFLGGVRFCSSPNGAYLCSGRTGDYAEPGFLAHPGPGDARAREWVVWYFRNAAIPMRVVLVLALFGAVWCWSERRDGQRVALFIGLTVAYFTLVPAMTQWPQDRYRLPIDAFLFMFAAAGVAAVVECLRPGARQPWA